MRAQLAVVLLVSAAACGDRGVGTIETDEGATSAADEAESAASESEDAGSTDEGSTTSETESTGETETTGETSPRTTEDTTSESGSTTAGDDELVLDPDTLEFFDLPIGSIRYAVAGQDLDSDTCVTLVWWEPEGQVCAQPDMQGWPYVVITPDAQAPCMQWDYSGNAVVDDAQGCVELSIFDDPVTAEVDVNVAVSGDLFTGTIVASNI